MFQNVSLAVAGKLPTLRKEQKGHASFVEKADSTSRDDNLWHSWNELLAPLLKSMWWQAKRKILKIIGRREMMRAAQRRIMQYLQRPDLSPDTWQFKGVINTPSNVHAR